MHSSSPREKYIQELGLRASKNLPILSASCLEIRFSSNKLWKILKEMGIQDHLTCLLETCMQFKKQQLEPDMEQRIGSKLGKSMSRLYIVILPT